MDKREEIAALLWGRFDSTGPDEGYTWDEMGQTIRRNYYEVADEILEAVRK